MAMAAMERRYLELLPKIQIPFETLCERNYGTTMMIGGLNFDLNEGQFLPRFATLRHGRFMYGHTGTIRIKFCYSEEQDKYRPGVSKLVSRGKRVHHVRPRVVGTARPG